MGAAQQARLARLRQRMVGSEVGGLAISAPSNIFYLSGFRGSSGALLITADRAALLSDSRYRLQAREQAPDYDFIEIERRLFGRLGELAREWGVRRLGYEPGHLTCQRRTELSEGLAALALSEAEGSEAERGETAELTPASLVEELRAVKSPEEVSCLRQAAALADQALWEMVALLRPGATERKIALAGEFRMRREGAEAAAFDLIVASGAHSALPHAETTERELRRGDLVVVDIGARVDGYCSDMTRTFAVRSASAQAQEIYSLVYLAQRAGAAAVKAGAVCGDVDAAARGLISAAGYGEAFGHGLGHGVGIEVHEAPRLGGGEETRLAAGNVVTVEPGVYLDGVGGVRLEDMLLVEPAGAETLTGAVMGEELPVV